MKPPVAQVLSSWWLTAGLLILFSASYLAFTFAQDAYVRWVHFLLHTPPGLAIYLGLIVNLFAATAQVAIKHLRQEPLSPDRIKTMDVWAELPAGMNPLAEMATWMQSKGFRPSVSADSVSSRVGVWSFLPGTVMRLGLAGFMISLLASVHVRETAIAIVHVGDAPELFGDRVAIREIDVFLTDDFLQVGDQSTFELDHALVKLAYQGKNYEITEGMPTRINGQYYRLVHLGYAQPLTVRTGRDTASQLADLDVLPPGKTDIVTLPKTSMFLTASLEPDRTIKKGLLKGKQYNLKSPFYRILVQSGASRDKPVAVLLKPGENRSAGGVNILAGKNLLYARVLVVKDPALFWIYASLVMTGMGLLLMITRFFWYRKQLAVTKSGDTIVIGWEEEFFKKWGIQRFYAWKDELAAPGTGK